MTHATSGRGPSKGRLRRRHAESFVKFVLLFVNFTEGLPAGEGIYNAQITFPLGHMFQPNAGHIVVDLSKSLTLLCP